MTHTSELDRPSEWRGRFLDVVDSLQIHLEEQFDALQYPTEAAILNSPSDAAFYEIDETEGNQTGHDGIFGVITIHLTLFNFNLSATTRRVVEIYSTNSFPESSATNRYEYVIDPKQLDKNLQPYLGQANNSNLR